MGYDVMFLKQMNTQEVSLPLLKGDYRFDAGPPLFTMPEYVDELFHLFNENPEIFQLQKKRNYL